MRESVVPSLLHQLIETLGTLSYLDLSMIVVMGVLPDRCNKHVKYFIYLFTRRF